MCCLQEPFSENGEKDDETIPDDDKPIAPDNIPSLVWQIIFSKNTHEISKWPIKSRAMKR